MTAFCFPIPTGDFFGDADLKDMSAIELRVARNEIFARHGRFFKDQVLANYFSQFAWYQPAAVEVPLEQPRGHQSSTLSRRRSTGSEAERIATAPRIPGERWRVPPQFVGIT